MKIIISPAKGFKNINGKTTLPVLTEKTEEIVKHIKTLSLEELKEKQKTSEKIAALNYERYKEFGKNNRLYPALLTFDGTAYKALDVESLDKESLSYLNNYLYILSGLYGALRPEDGIRPYRLDLNDKVKVNGKSLKEFFSDSVYKTVTDGDTIINLASKEYSSLVVPYIKDELLVNCTFLINKNGKYRELSTWSKKARGLMLRYMAEEKIMKPKKLKDFNELGFKFNEERSITKGKIQEYIFLKEEINNY